MILVTKDVEIDVDFKFCNGTTTDPIPEICCVVQDDGTVIDICNPSKNLNINVDTELDTEVDIDIDKDLSVDLNFDSDVDISGNLANLTFDVTAIGDNSFAEADTSVVVTSNLTEVSGTFVAGVGDSGEPLINDLFDGDPGDDEFDGGIGNDTLNGNEGNDKLFGGPGDDLLFGGPDNDMLFGEDGNDSLDGGEGDDTLNGGNGDDTLTGNKGDNFYEGGKGNDLLIGGSGDGVDTFFFNSEPFGNDTLKGIGPDGGFLKGEDRIVLSQIPNIRDLLNTNGDNKLDEKDTFNGVVGNVIVGSDGITLNIPNTFNGGLFGTIFIEGVTELIISSSGGGGDVIF